MTSRYVHTTAAEQRVARVIVNFIGTIFYLELVIGGVAALAIAWSHSTYYPVLGWLAVVVNFILGALFVDQLQTAAQMFEPQGDRTDGKET